jgi:hypothetical protein
MRCLKLLSCVVLLIAVGCVNFSVSSTTIDPDTKIAITNSFSGHFFFSKSTAEKIDVAYKTKTTSKLFGAKAIETTGDVEMVKAISAAVGEAFAAGAKAAAKP